MPGWRSTNTIIDPKTGQAVANAPQPDPNTQQPSGAQQAISQIPVVGQLITPDQINTKAVSNTLNQTNQGVAGFAQERANAQNGIGTAGVNTAGISPLQQRQTGALNMLQQAANGAVPSAADLQSARQSQIAAANQYGMAAALAGRNPGAALNTASNGAANVQGQAIANGAAQRAAEQATARDQYAQATQGALGQAQALGTTNAQLQQDQQKMLLQAQLQEQGYSADMAKAIVDANAKQAAANTQFKSSFVGGLESLI